MRVQENMRRVAESDHLRSSSTSEVLQAGLNTRLQYQSNMEYAHPEVLVDTQWVYHLKHSKVQLRPRVCLIRLDARHKLLIRFTYYCTKINKWNVRHKSLY